MTISLNSGISMHSNRRPRSKDISKQTKEEDKNLDFLLMFGNFFIGRVYGALIFRKTDDSS